MRPREASRERVEKQRQADREALRLTPARELARQTHHRVCFGGHASAFFTECSSEDGQPSVRLTPIKLADRSGQKSDSLYHPGLQGTRACIVCEKEFVPARTDAKTCGSACRQKAYRTRNAEAQL